MPKEKCSPSTRSSRKAEDTAITAVFGQRADKAAIRAAIDQAYQIPFAGPAEYARYAPVAPSLDVEQSRRQAEEARVPEPSIFVPSADYRSIQFRGRHYGLTRNQAKIVKLLHEAYQDGAPGVGKEALLAAIEAETSRVRDSFRGSPLWGRLIIPNRQPRGTYQLNLKAK